MSLLLLALAAIVQTSPALSPVDLPPGSQIVAIHVSPPVKLTNVPASGEAAPPTPAELAGPPDQAICKLIATTGTRFMKSDCRTRAEWNQLAVDSRQATLDLQSGQNGFSNSDFGRLSSGGK